MNELKFLTLQLAPVGRIYYVFAIVKDAFSRRLSRQVCYPSTPARYLLVSNILMWYLNFYIWPSFVEKFEHVTTSFRFIVWLLKPVNKYVRGNINYNFPLFHLQENVHLNISSLYFYVSRCFSVFQCFGSRHQPMSLNAIHLSNHNTRENSSPCKRYNSEASIEEALRWLPGLLVCTLFVLPRHTIC